MVGFDIDPRESRGGSIGSVWWLLALLAAVLNCWGLLRPPALRDATTTAAEFSAARAMPDVVALAQAPHPVGTPAHADVRRHLIERMAALGLDPQEQVATALRISAPGEVDAARVHNLLGRLAGARGSGKAVLLIAHYDSVALSPGASDDAAGVATVLEIVRALNAGPRPANDVLILITDAEELGLLGARAFALEHPWMNEVGVAINFEARGTSGPSLMFETSSENRWLIRELAAAARPVAFSYAAEIYRLLSNRTDLTILLEQGLPGLNFAFIHGAKNYHNSGDTLEHLDPQSVQHHGDNGLTLVRRLGDLDLGQAKTKGNAVYFSLLGLGLVEYSELLARLLAGLTLLLAGLVFGSQIRRGEVRPLGLAAGAALAAAVTALAAAIGLLISALVARPSAWPLLETWGRTALAIAALLLVLCFSAWAGRSWAKRLRLSERLAGGLLLWWLATLATALWAPGASYLFTWPTLIAAAAALAAAPVQEGRSRSLRQDVGHLLLVLSTLLLWLPTICLVASALGPLQCPALGLLAALLWFLFAPVLLPRQPAPQTTRRLDRLALVAALALVAVALALGRPGRANNLLYIQDHDRQRAIWASLDRRVDEWTQPFLGDAPRQESASAYFRGRSQKLLVADAPWLSLPEPDVRLLSTAAVAGGRQVNLRVLAGQATAAVRIELASKVGIRQLCVLGHCVEGGAWLREGRSPEWCRLLLSAPDPLGFEVQAVLEGTSDLEVQVTRQLFELPLIPGRTVPPRPAGLMPRPSWFGDVTLVHKTFSFPGAAAGQEGGSAVP